MNPLVNLWVTGGFAYVRIDVGPEEEGGGGGGEGGNGLLKFAWSAEQGLRGSGVGWADIVVLIRILTDPVVV